MRHLTVLLFLMLSLRLFGIGPEIVGHTPAYTLPGSIPVYTGFYCNSYDDEAGNVTIRGGYASSFQQVKIDGKVVMELNEPVSEIEINLSKYVIGYEDDTITHLLELASAGGTNQGKLYFCRHLPTQGGCVLLVPATYEGMVIGVNPNTKNVYVPSEYWVTEDYSMPITSIGDGAFKQASEMETLSIPGDITSIQYDAFLGCTGLQEVTIGDSENMLSVKNAHMMQPNLFPDSPVKKIYIGRTITNTSGTTIAPFKELKTLEEVSFTSSPITLAENMFADCISLKNIVIPVYATWPEGLAQGNSTDPQGMFSGCTSLETVSILTKGAYSTGSWMFFNCSALSNVRLPNTIQRIAVGTFSGCESLKDLPINNLSSLNTIGQYAFAGCNGLDCVQIPSGITDIGSKAFQNCQNLTTVIFPTTRFELGQDALAYCDRIREVFYLADGNLSYTQTPYIFENSVYNLATLYVLNSMTDRIAGAPWNRFSKVEGCKNARLPFIKFSSDTIDTYWEGEAQKIKIDYKIVPQALSDNAIIWESSDSGIAEIIQENEECIVELNSIGEAELRATLSNGNYAQCKVKVMPVLVESLELTPSSIEAIEGEKVVLEAIVLPEVATDKTLEWSSSDDKIATVDNTGLVTVLKEGNCVITARTTDGSDITAECHISITTGVEDITLDAAVIVDVYTLDGVKIKSDCMRNDLEDLTPGIYILRKGNKVEKLIIR